MNTNPLAPTQPRYPAVQVFLRYGNLIAILAGLAPLAGVAWLVVEGASAWWIAAGVAAGAFVFLLMRSYAELVTIIADMLLPK